MNKTSEWAFATDDRLIKVQIWVCLFLHVLRRKGTTKNKYSANKIKINKNVKVL